MGLRTTTIQLARRVAPIAMAAVVGGCSSGTTGTGPTATPAIGDAAQVVVGTTGPPATSRDPRLSPLRAPSAWQMDVVQMISPAYRQGVARDGDDWIWSFNTALFRTSGDDLKETLQAGEAIPPDLVAQGYNHIGDIDVDTATDTLWAPLEMGDKEKGVQRMAAYDPTTGAFKGSFEVMQHHASFVTIDAGARIAYSQDQFGGDSLLRYKMPDPSADPATPWTPMEPLKMSSYVDKVQGADIDVDSGLIYLATDDDHDGIYGLDPVDGTVVELTHLAEPEWEGEGIDVTWIEQGPFRGLLHVMSVGGVEPGRFEHFANHEG